MKASEGWVDCKKSTLKEMQTKWRKLKLPTMADKNAEKVWKTVAWAIHDGRAVDDAALCQVRWLVVLAAETGVVGRMKFTLSRAGV